MKAKSRFNKGVALVLSAALVLGFAPVIPGNVYNRVLADGSEGTSVNGSTETSLGTDTSSIRCAAYATQEQLSGDTYRPDNYNYARLNFGKNSDGDTQTWYILGGDGKSTDDRPNTVLFAEKNMMEDVAFRSTADDSGEPQDKQLTNIGTIQSLVQGGNIKYGSYNASNLIMLGAGGDSFYVYANHYGASDVRAMLQDAVSGDKYFTEAEKNLLRRSYITTADTRHNNIRYTTSDYLYLPSAKTDTTYDLTNIYVGSSSDESGNGIRLSRNFYWASGVFWLRSAALPGNFPSSTEIDSETAGDYALFTIDDMVNNSLDEIVPVYGGYATVKRDVNRPRDVRPATAIYLDDVLFASTAVSAAAQDQDECVYEKVYESGTLSTDPMSLRFNGSDKDIGTVKLQGGGTHDKDKIVVSGVSKDNVSLVVQTTTKNAQTWYYSKKITGDTTINFAELLDKLKTEKLVVAINYIRPTDDVLSKSAIWLEYTDDDGMIYAVNATYEPHEHEWEEIESDDCIVGSSSYTSSADGKTCVKETRYYKSCECGEINYDEWFDRTEYPDHEYELQTNSRYHWKECKNCLHIDEATMEEHSFDPKTEKCECGQDLSGHNIQFVEGKAATCTSDGYESYYECKVDGHTEIYKVNGIGALIEADSIVEIPATKHYASTYQSDGTKHWKICENENDGRVCGERFDEADHTFDGNKCTVCLYPKSSDGGSSDNSNTSDGGNSGNSGTTYSDGSTKNSDRSSSSGSSSGGSGGSSSGSTGSGTVFLSGGSAGITGTTGTGWMKDSNNRWWYYDTTYGKILGWVFEKTTGKWYYVDANNGRLNGWFHDTDTGYWYYLDDTTGAMLTGWQTISGKQYYFAPIPSVNTYSFNTSSAKWYYDNPAGNRPYGSMYANTTTPDNHQVDADGVKVQ